MYYVTGTNENYESEEMNFELPSSIICMLLWLWYKICLLSWHAIVFVYVEYMLSIIFGNFFLTAYFPCYLCMYVYIYICIHGEQDIVLVLVLRVHSGE